MATGNQGEPLDALIKLCVNNIVILKLKIQIQYLITFTPSPSMEIQMYNTMNQLAKAGATCIDC